MNNILSLVNHL